jgi:ribonuclease HI
MALSIKAMVANCNRARTNKNGMIKKGWTKPPGGKVKLNTDAAVDLATRRASTGCIIRDSQGQFLAACRVEIEGVIDVTTAEAQAVRDGLRLAERIGCNNLIVETDCLEVVNAYNFPMENRIIGVAFLDESRTMMVGFNEASISHCSKEENRAAHQLARSTDDSNCIFWLESPHFFLYPQLVNDVTIL